MELKQTGGPSGKGPSVTYLRMAGPHMCRPSQVLTPGTCFIREATSGLLAQTSRDYTARKHNLRA